MSYFRSCLSVFLHWTLCMLFISHTQGHRQLNLLGNKEPLSIENNLLGESSNTFTSGGSGATNLLETVPGNTPAPFTQGSKLVLDVEPPSQSPDPPSSDLTEPIDLPAVLTPPLTVSTVGDTPLSPPDISDDGNVADEDLEQGELVADGDPGVAGVDTNIPEEQRTETVLRNSVLNGDIDGAAAIIAANDIVTGGFGLRSNDEEERIEISANRNTDADVIAFKALARAALDTSDSTKTGNVVALSYMNQCQCNPFVSEEYAAIIRIFTDVLSDQAFLRRAIATNVTEIAARSRRSLLHVRKSPTNSFLCAGCWPRRACSEFSWCR